MRKLDVVDYTYGRRSSDDVNTSLPFNLQSHSKLVNCPKPKTKFLAQNSIWLSHLFNIK